MGETKCSCPKGKYLNGICNGTSNPVCETCPHKTYTDVENKMPKCRACRECFSNKNQIIGTTCEPDKDTQCICKPGFYCIHPIRSHCDQCIPVSKCPPGQGVTKKYTFDTDTVCSPCPNGSYSNENDYTSSCRNHTSCEALGRIQNFSGTDKTDAVCGDFKACSSCHWMLPASLWAGLVVTALIVFLALFLFYWKTKRQSQRSVIISEYKSSTSPVLPPDILKYPADCCVEKHEENQKLTHLVENFPSMDCSIECDGPVMTLMTMPERYSQLCAANRYTDSITCHTIYQSEPQETEWTD